MRLPWMGPAVSLGRAEPGLPLLSPRVCLRGSDLEHSATVWGKSGSGKSKLLQSVFLQHLQLGHGIGVLEPHNDLSQDLLASLVAKGFFNDSDAFRRLVYIDWGNGAYVPFNVLAGGERDPHAAALAALEAMLRVWPELEEAPMFQTLFLAGTTALIANSQPLTRLYELLTDTQYRTRCLAAVTDPLVLQTFETYRRLGRDQVHAAGSALRRMFLLAFSPVTRFTLGQPDNWLDLRRMMDAGTSFIFNLGNIADHETRNLVGAMLLVQLEQAALSRADTPPSQRRPFTMIVDEWPSFAAGEKTIGTILSQARKYKLRLWLAGQSTTQISSRRLAGALENCGITVSFGLGRESAEAQARHIGFADPFAVKEPAPRDTLHNQFMSIADQFELWTGELQNLPPRSAYLKLPNRRAVQFKTRNVPTPDLHPEALSPVFSAYRKRYQRSAAEVAASCGSGTGGGVKGPTPLPPAYARLFTMRR